MLLVSLSDPRVIMSQKKGKAQTPMGSTRKEPARSFAERDVVESRKWYCYTQRPGVTAKIKRAIRRRARRNWRRDDDE